jgi:hypothetical protein
MSEPSSRREFLVRGAGAVAFLGLPALGAGCGRLRFRGSDPQPSGNPPPKKNPHEASCPACGMARAPESSRRFLRLLTDGPC